MIKKPLAVLATLMVLLASCDDNDGGGSSLSFQATIPPLNVVLGASVNNYAQFVSGDEVGIFVDASTEKTYTADASGSTSTFTAAETALTSAYGDYAHILVPLYEDGVRSYYKSSVYVPSSQTYEGGRNPNMLNLFGSAKLYDDKADIEMTHYGAVLCLGFTSSEDITLSKVIIEATDPSSGKYLAGEMELDFDVEHPLLTPETGSVSSGSNSITVSIPDGLSLGSDVQYVPIGVLPFSTKTSGLTLTLYEENNYPSYYGEILTDDLTIGSEGKISVGAGEIAFYDIDLTLDDFVLPVVSTITVTDYETKESVADQEVYIYSVEDQIETLLDTYTSDENGQISVEFNAGTYKAYSSIDGEAPVKSNFVEFTVADKSQEIELMLYPVVFWDDMEWITAEMGGDVTLKPLYASISPATANSSASDECVWTAATDEAKAIIEEKGWTLTSWVYLRPGVFKMGKNNSESTATTPKISGFTSGDMVVNFSLISWHRVVNSAWTYEPCYFVLEISGSGSFSETSTVTSYTSDNLPSAAPSAPDQVWNYSFTVYGAGSDTQISITNKKPTSSTDTAFRMMLDEFSIAAIED